jgi:hypothetical protein
MKILLRSTPDHAIRLGSFPDLFAVGEYQGTPTNYSAQLLIPKGSPALKDLEAKLREFAKDTWGDAAKTAWEKQSAGNLKVLRDGDGIDGVTSDGSPKPGWAGCVRIKASSKFQPKIVDTALNELTEESGKPYPGCAVSAQIQVYAFKDKKELGLRLLAIQFVADGERLGGGGTLPVDLNEFGPATDSGGW